MEKFLLVTLTSISFSVAADTYQGPLGDQWDKYHTVRITSPLQMKSSMVIKTDKLILENDIITNGHKLDIEAREIFLKNGAQISAFASPQLPILSIPDSPKNMGTAGLSGSDRPGGHGSNGGTGPDGDIGLDGLDGNMNPAPITVKAFFVEGQLFLMADGQDGGKGGKGAPGGKGGKGGDGRNGWAKVSSTCGRRQEHGGNGGDGGAGGLGGKGGKGGNGGVNVSLELLLPEAKFNFSSVPGKAGIGGEPGEIGPSGDIGKGGKGAEDEIDNAMYSCTANAKAGKNGTQKVRRESQVSYNSRVGTPGNKYDGQKNATQIEKVNHLYSQKGYVLSNTYSFHFARLYKILVQDTLRLIAQEEVTRSQVQNISENTARLLLVANQRMVDELIMAWTRNFHDKIADLEEFSLYKKNSLLVIDVLKDIRKSEKGAADLKEDISLLIADADKLMKLKMRNLLGQCLKLNELILEGQLSLDFSLVQTPVCREEVVRNLLVNPKSPLVINIKREKGVFTDGEVLSSVSIEETEVNQERRIAQTEPVIILYNKTFTESDIRRSVPALNDKTQAADMISFNTPSEDEVSIQNIRSHIQSLGLGASLN